MYYTLSQLRDSINRKIVAQGEHSPVAAFIFTSEDVISEDDNCDVVTYSDGVIQEVLIGIGDSDYIYEMIHDKIQIEIAESVEQTQTVTL